LAQSEAQTRAIRLVLAFVSAAMRETAQAAQIEPRQLLTAFMRNISTSFSTKTVEKSGGCATALGCAGQLGLSKQAFWRQRSGGKKYSLDIFSYRRATY
jgi:hypothetical protein